MEKRQRQAIEDFWATTCFAGVILGASEAGWGLARRNFLGFGRLCLQALPATTPGAPTPMPMPMPITTRIIHYGPEDFGYFYWIFLLG